MIAEDIRARVARHYDKPDGDAMPGEPLLLSELGKDLVKAGAWPVEGDKRSLTRFLLDETPELIVRADPQVKAFVVVAPSGRDDLVEAAFAKRRDDYLVKRLPRPLLLAFCVDHEGPVRVSITPPYRYDFEAEVEGGKVLIETKFRMPGIYIDEARNLPPGLVNNIKDWAKAHDLDLADLIGGSPPKSERPHGAGSAAANALERLHAAQPEDVRARLVVPLDIALALSRMP